MVGVRFICGSLSSWAVMLLMGCSVGVLVGCGGGGKLVCGGGELVGCGSRPLVCGRGSQCCYLKPSEWEVVQEASYIRMGTLPPGSLPR